MQRQPVVISLREALHKAIHTMGVAKDTGNRDLYSQARQLFMAHWHERNVPNKTLTLR